ncbi:low-temperature-induced 65 kDa protein-like isoform X2 [Gastrolobium bilobum]|uniref:low-temperature-induced 65 kDa protein-like isoform X2 n=1 Tax=Gastrolobium bilobum TaxID=150636 RepID=UPI002AAFF6D1|nr:low-temperature-induced 65 kDa protein-like isoform X2 [Gastrolobium bilobum]
MDSRVVESQVHENDEHHPYNVASQQVAHGAEEPHSDHEKKSVLNKVKAKAKKIKDTIKKQGQHVLDHGHEYNNEDQHIPDDHDLDEDEETVEDPEVQGAPMYESEAVKSATPTSEQVRNLGKSGTNFGGARVMGEEHHQDPLVVGDSSTTEINQTISSDPDKKFAGEEKPGQYKVNLERPIGLDEDPHAPGSKPEAYIPPNYQTKVTDPRGAGIDEIEITPVEESFAEMKVHDEPKHTPEPNVKPTIVDTQYSPAGSHEEQQKSGDASNMSGSTAEYGKNIAHSMAEKLAPVYGKVAGVGSAVKSKVSGTITGGVRTETKNGVEEEDKGVSVKDYLAEKLRPGEEDKALSEVISEALHKRKEEEPVKIEHENLDIVDDKSEKVYEESSVKSPGKGVVDKLKGVVGSWFGKSEENQSSQVAGGEDLSENKNSGAEVEHVTKL